MARLVLVLLLALSGLVLACGQKATPGAGMMPASAAYDASGNLEPMVVDWQPEQRGDLEASMREGLVVVDFGPRGLRLLRDCRVDGAYSFLGMTRRERVLRLRSQDDVRANLPLGGAGLAARLGGEFEKGATLDIAMIMVGRIRSTRARVTKADLHGACDGATHVIRGATLGAFAVDRGESTRARTAVEIFGAGAGGGTASSSSVRVVDGQLASCEAAAPDSPRPPSQCGAVMRLELVPLTTGEAKDASASKETAALDACVPPLVRVDGICSRPRSGTAAECDSRDPKGCLAACNAGEPASCWKLGRMLFHGENGLAKSPVEATPFFRRSCEGKDAHGCMFLGISYYQGNGVPKDRAKAAALHDAACRAGDADGCGLLGQMFRDGQGVERSLPAAEAALTRACNGGRSSSCSDIGFMAMGLTQGVVVDQALAARLFKRGCEGDDSAGCANLGLLQEFGLGTGRSVDLALQSYRKACRLAAIDCGPLAALAQQGIATGPGEAPADLFRRACTNGAPTSCAYLRTFVDARQPVETEAANELVKNALTACDNGLPRSCTSAGLILMGQGKTREGQPLVQRGCRAGDRWACGLASAKPLR